MRVAILGCGPAGLIAAHAAESLGHNVTIYSRKQKSWIFGAQYLHAPIPGISPEEPELEIEVVKMGTREGYALSVYGNENATVSWDNFQVGPTPGWSLSGAYDKLWLKYDSKIVNKVVSGRDLDRIGETFGRVFSTIPARSICRDWCHRFPAVDITVVHGRIDREPRWNVMYYNGLPSNDLGNWYRYSVINGYQSWEYATVNFPRIYEPIKPGLRIDRGRKPLCTDCDCRPWLHRLGRFGKWHKHAFTHHAYEEVRNALLGV